MVMKLSFTATVTSDRAVGKKRCVISFSPDFTRATKVNFTISIMRKHSAGLRWREMTDDILITEIEHHKLIRPFLLSRPDRLSLQVDPSRRGHLKQALVKLGVTNEMQVRLRTVRDLHSGEDFPARSIVYSVQSTWRRAVSRGWNATLFRLLKSNPLLRISIHPPDYSHPEIWRQILDLIEATSERRAATTYQDWVAEQRLRARSLR